MIDINKKYRTRSGRKIRIYATDHIGDYPVVGAIKTKEGWAFSEWTKDGKLSVAPGISDYDLIEYSPEQELLEEAKRRYPIGTIVKSLSGDYESIICGYNHYSQTENEIWFIGNKFHPKIYSEGQWAEIVSEKETSPEIDLIINKLQNTINEAEEVLKKLKK